MRLMGAHSSLKYDRLKSAVSEKLTSNEWSLTETSDGYRITLFERTVTVTVHEGPRRLA